MGQENSRSQRANSINSEYKLLTQIPSKRVEVTDGSMNGVHSPEMLDAKYYFNKLKSILVERKQKSDRNFITTENSKPICIFDSDIINGLLEIDYFMWIEVFDLWNASVNKNRDYEHATFSIFTCELLVQLMAAKGNLEDDDYALGRKICYVMEKTNCHFTATIFYVHHKSDNFVMHVLVRDLSLDNFDTHTKFLAYIFENNSQTEKASIKYRWVYISYLMKTKTLREYFIHTVKTQNSPMEILCSMLKFGFDTDKQYQKIINACIEEFDGVSYPDVMRSFLTRGYITKSIDVQTDIFNKILSKCGSVKFNFGVFVPRMSVCANPIIVQFMIDNVISEYGLIKHALKNGSYNALRTIISVTKSDTIKSSGEYGHCFSFGALINDYIKLNAGSCADFYMAYSKYMTSQNLNEIIHIAIEQPNSTAETIQMFVDELKKRGIKTDTSLFVCSIEAKNKFGKILSEIYNHIATK
jgi:hypothetical protein